MTEPNLVKPNNCNNKTPQGHRSYQQMLSTDAPTFRVIRLPEVMNRIGLGRSSIYSYMELGAFPRSITLGPRCVGWLEHEIDGWIAARLSSRVPNTAK